MRSAARKCSLMRWERGYVRATCSTNTIPLKVKEEGRDGSRVPPPTPDPSVEPAFTFNISRRFRRASSC